MDGKIRRICIILRAINGTAATVATRRNVVAKGLGQPMFNTTAGKFLISHEIAEDCTWARCSHKTEIIGGEDVIFSVTCCTC